MPPLEPNDQVDEVVAQPRLVAAIGLLPGDDISRRLLDDYMTALAQGANQRRLAASRRTGQYVPPRHAAAPFCIARFTGTLSGSRWTIATN